MSSKYNVLRSVYLDDGENSDLQQVSIRLGGEEDSRLGPANIQWAFPNISMDPI